ncbi:MAG TPA: BrnT family toxin [Geminicoccus sp.]|uniref:BrnT family toxin n=1 Tax=Geminicoccus sp. TaxID=2024832 RepID=UPI002BAABB80|nr:BrnT family toxin [Geminicoccus sp.]HWL67967.1 BrnT family toxin [Geminicoccus sp.]
MRFSCDPAKDASNLVKHGIGLLAAAQLDWDVMLVMPDERRDYGELREIGYAPMDGRLYCVVFTRRGDVLHVISLRKANLREFRRYEAQAAATE